MWKQKIGMSIGNYPIPTQDAIQLLANIGFDAISPVWRENEDLAPIAQWADRSGLTLQSIHAPFRYAADLWSSDKACQEKALLDLTAVLEDCRRFRIPIMVAHVWKGFGYTQEPGKSGLDLLT